MSAFSEKRLLYIWRGLRFLHFYLEWIRIYQMNDNIWTDTFSDDITQQYNICWNDRTADSYTSFIIRRLTRIVASLIFTCHLHILVAEVTLFEQCRCCWTIFSHRSLALLLTLDFESNTERCWDSTQTPLSLYGTHCCDHSLLIVPLSCLSSRLSSVFLRSTSTMLIGGSPPCWSVTRFYTTTHSHVDTPAWRLASGTKQATDIKQQLDLVAQTEQCPYIGSSFG